MINIKFFEEYPDLYKPKRFIKYSLIWCSEGEADIVVDEKELNLKKHDVLTITSGEQLLRKKIIGNNKEKQRGTFFKAPQV